MAQGIPTRLSPSELRRFGLTLAVPLSLLAAWGAWRGHMLTPALLGGVAGVLALLALGAPGLLQPVHKGWMRLAEALGWFNTRLLLGIVYYLMMTPLGVAMRLLGRDPLNRRLHDGTSYWIAKDAQGDPKGTMERRF